METTYDYTHDNDIIKLTTADDIVGKLTGNLSWVYDIKTGNMTFEVYSSPNKEPDKYLLENYINSIKAVHVIFKDDEPVFDVFCAELEAGKDEITSEYRGVSLSGATVWFRQIAHTVIDESNVPSLVVGRRMDISNEKNSDGLANKTPVQDALTGLYYREKAKEIISACLSPDSESALILIDIDGFHKINDSYGKMYGDVVLQTLSGVIYTNFMTKDVISRISGDQFMVFCRDIEHDKVIYLINELNNRIKSNVVLRDNKSLSVSIGVAFAPTDGAEFFLLYTKADIALLKAKEAGGGMLVEYDKDTMKNIFVGSTYRKMSYFIEEESKLYKDESKVNKKLFDYSFDTLSKNSDIPAAITSILKEVCLHYGIDRAFLNEHVKKEQCMKIAVKWCKTDDGNDYADRNFPDSVLDSIAQACEKDGYILFEDGRGQGLDFFREIVSLNKPPVSSMFIPVYDEDVIAGLMVFETFEHHEYNNNEITTIRSIVNLISSYRMGQNAKQELEAETIINKNVMDAQKIIFYIVDEETHRLKYISKQAKKIFPGAEYSKVCYEALHGRCDHCNVCPIHDGKGEDHVVECYDDVNDRWYTLNATKMKETASSHDILVCVSDVTDFVHRVKRNDRLTVASSYDSFVETASKFIKHKEIAYQIVCCGIRKFSKINDEYGYVVGDEILKRFAEQVNSRLKEGEIICRVKGDDFVILLKQDDQIDLGEMFRDCSEALTKEFKETYSNIEIVCFAGSYDITPEEEYINHCIDRALKARQVAYADKSVGGYSKYTKEIESKERQEEELSAKMKQSLNTGGFKVFFQPKVDIVDGTIVGAEALVRLQDEDGKMVSPGLFIPLAEKTGMVVDIDNSVYEQTFAYMAKWLKEGKKLPLISVNVSRLHLLDDTLPKRMKNLASRYGLDSSQIELEITESVFFEDTERLISMIMNLKEEGFVISMDDFGSGYSTLNFMKSLPVDVIKIDGGFFMRNELDNKSKAVISAIMQLTKSLEFDSVSEGVETKEQVDFIREQGGRCVQGYYFYKPMPADEFATLI